MTTRDQIAAEKQKILQAARVSELKRLAARTSTAFSVLQEAAGQIVGHASLIDRSGADVYRPLPPRKPK
jgi:hypothetical protein